MRTRFLLAAAAVAAFTALAAGCGGSGESASPAPSTGPADTSGGAATTEGSFKKGGILRIGTISYIDSLNPYNYIQTQATNAMNMIFPQLVQYDYGPNGYHVVGDWATSWETSPDGKDWTFHLKPGGKWSDGKPLTADDAVWTINTTVKYQAGPTGEMAAALSHVTGADAPDDSTLVIHYEAPVGNALAQLQQLWVLPRHVWEPLTGTNGKGLKSFHPEQNLPMVTGGAYTIKQWEKKGTTVFIADPGYYGTPSNAEAVTLTYYTNSDSVIADLKGGQLDWVDQVPFNAVDVLKQDPDVVLTEVPGSEITNITWNSNPRKPTNRELLDPKVKEALSMCVDRQQIIDVVFSGYASTVETLVGHISPLENPDVGPLEYDCDAANKMLDDLGYARGSDGIRVAPATTGAHAQPAHPMTYEIVTPTSVDFNIDREFQIVKDGFEKLGVKVTQKVGGDTTASYAIETGKDCDPKTSKGYTGWDIAMWDWLPYIDPDFQLSVVTKAQWCSWGDTGWDNPAYDAMYRKQGTLVDPEERRKLVYEMQQIIYDNFIYTQLVNQEYIDAHVKSWDIPPEITNLNAYGKIYYTRPHKVG
jgi:peptide/nickel transport system substrate-binding protein